LLPASHSRRLTSRGAGHREKIEDGTIELVEKENFPVKDHMTRPIQRDIWEGALRAAASVEKEIGLENLGP